MVNRFILNETSYFGAGAISVIPDEVKNRGFKKVLVVTDKSLMKFNVATKVLKVLDDAGIAYEVYDEVKPNPTIENIQTGVETYKKAGADCLIAIGGGSSMDTAKAVGTLLANGGNIRTWATPAVLEHPIVPLIAVPTTAGTGSEVTFDAVITDTEAHEKLNILDIKIAPKVALVDPTVLKGLPEKVMASTGVDALIHAVEAYTCKAASPVTDAFALYAIDLIGANIREAVYQRTPESCKAMMLGSTMAGVAFGYSDVAAVHCIAEALGGRYDTPHGVSNAMVLSTVTEFNIPANTEKYAEVARHLGVDTTGMTEKEAAYRCVDAMKSICTDVKIPKMRDFEVINPADFQALAEASFRNMSTPNNPRELSVQDFFDLLTKAYNA